MHVLCNNFFQVNVSLNVRNIFEVNEKAQYITLETSIRMIWIDERVRSNPKPNSGVDFVSINGDQIHKFWVPDIFIDQAVKTRNPKVHVMPATLRVFPNGLIRSVVHISLFRSTTVVSCLSPIKYYQNYSVISFLYDVFWHCLRWLHNPSFSTRTSHISVYSTMFYHIISLILYMRQREPNVCLCLYVNFVSIYSVFIGRVA